MSRRTAINDLRLPVHSKDYEGHKKAPASRVKLVPRPPSSKIDATSRPEMNAFLARTPELHERTDLLQNLNNTDLRPVGCQKNSFKRLRDRRRSRELTKEYLQRRGDTNGITRIRNLSNHSPATHLKCRQTEQARTQRLRRTDCEAH